MPIALAVYAFIDVLSIPAVRYFRGPKWLWAIAVVVLPVVGPVLWFLVGRPRRAAVGQRYSAPDDDPDFLRGLKPPSRPSGDDDTPRPSTS